MEITGLLAGKVLSMIDGEPATPAEIHTLCELHGFVPKKFDMLTGTGGWEVSIPSQKGRRFVMPDRATINWWIEQCEQVSRKL